MTKKVPKKKQASKKERTGESVSTEWTVTETRTHRRWWWWLAWGYVTFALVCLLFALGEWLMAIVALLIFASVVVTYAKKPRAQQYAIKGSTLTVDGRHIDLTKYDRFIFDEPRRSPSGHLLPDQSIQLLPTAYLGLPQSILLPIDQDEADGVVRALKQQHVTRDDSDAYSRSDRVWHRITRWMKLG